MKYLSKLLIKLLLMLIMHWLALIESCYNDQDCYTTGNVMGSYYSSERMEKIDKERQSRCAGSCVANYETLMCCPYRDEPEQYRILHQYCLEAHLPIAFVTAGMDVKSNEYPFMAALGWRVRQKYARKGIEYKCSGTMIEDRHLITAAHCLHQFSEHPVVARPGGDSANAEDFEVDQIFEHPDYKYPKLYNDIAIIRLKESYLPILSIDGRACIWYGRLDGEAAVMAIGYRAGASTPLLTTTNLYTITNEQCQVHYNNEDKDKLRDGISAKQICATAHEKQRDNCKGDSGGPIIMYDSYKDYNPIAYIVGITSYGIGCGTGAPRIYTRVSEYFDWIEEVVFK